SRRPRLPGSRVRSRQRAEARGRDPAADTRPEGRLVQRRDVAAVVSAVLVAAVCVRLGIWQLDRLHQRRARNAAWAARLALPPLTVTGSTPADSARERRVQARGVY